MIINRKSAQWYLESRFTLNSIQLNEIKLNECNEIISFKKQFYSVFKFDFLRQRRSC